MDNAHPKHRFDGSKQTAAGIQQQQMLQKHQQHQHRQQHIPHQPHRARDGELPSLEAVDQLPQQDCEQRKADGQADAPDPDGRPCAHRSAGSSLAAPTLAPVSLQALLPGGAWLAGVALLPGVA